MNKSFQRLQRQFGINLKNQTYSEHDIESKLALKPKSKKKCDAISNIRTLLSPEIKYFEEIMERALTSALYPHTLKGSQKIKRDIETLLHEVTTNSYNCLWNVNYSSQIKGNDRFFCNKHITLERRVILMNWIITIHSQYTLRQETLALTIKLIDEYCQKSDVSLKRYQLLGISALFIAAKYEEIELPKFKDYYRFIQDQFTPADMIQCESQILNKIQFSLVQKISSLWFMEAFAFKDIIFPELPKYSKRQNHSEKDDSQTEIQRLTSVQRYEKYMKFAKYVLNLIQLDYKITIKYKEDVVGIAVLIFTSIQKEFIDTDSKNLLKFFVQTKSRLIQQIEDSSQISTTVKKCIKKIQNIYQKRKEKRFEAINKKFQINLNFYK